MSGRYDEIGSNESTAAHVETVGRSQPLKDGHLPRELSKLGGALVVLKILYPSVNSYGMPFTANTITTANTINRVSGELRSMTGIYGHWFWP